MSFKSIKLDVCIIEQTYLVVIANNTDFSIPSINTYNIDLFTSKINSNKIFQHIKSLKKINQFKLVNHYNSVELINSLEIHAFFQLIRYNSLFNKAKSLLSSIISDGYLIIHGDTTDDDATLNEIISIRDEMTTLSNSHNYMAQYFNAVNILKNAEINALKNQSVYI